MCGVSSTPSNISPSIHHVTVGFGLPERERERDETRLERRRASEKGRVLTSGHLADQREVVTFQEWSAHPCHLSPLSIVYHRPGWLLCKWELLAVVKKQRMDSKLALTDEGQIHAKVSRRRIYEIHPAPEDPLVPVRDLGHLQPRLMPVADLKVGPLPKIVADRPVNGGSEIPASRVQAAQKNF